MFSSKKILRWIKIVLIVYVIVGALLYFLQEKILFHPEKLPEDYRYGFAQPFREINLDVNDEKIINIIQFTVPDSVCRGVVLYFHGNRKNIGRYASYAAHFTRNNYEVWMIDYPGFGKSTGEFDEEILYQDAGRFYKLARSRFAPDSIILYGKSLGSGIASQLASKHDCKRLILETPYYSFDALINHFAFMYPARLIAKYHFPTHRHLENVTAPVHILHGTSDRIVPYGQSVRLKRKLPELDLIEIRNGSHNDLHSFPAFQNKLDSLLNLP
mgnify:CR=1 FL=1